MRRYTTMMAWALWGLAMLALMSTAWLDHLLGRAGRHDLGGFDAATLTVAATHAGLATVGAVVASRRPRHPVGWLLLLAFGVLGQTDFAVAMYADYGLLARPGELPGAWLAARYFHAIGAAAFGCLAFILLLTPTGSLPSRSAGWRWLATLIAGTPIALFLTVTLAPQPSGQPYHPPESPFDLGGYDGVLLVAYQVAFAVSFAAVAVGAASLIVRFRRARGTERQQLRWVALAAALAAMLFLGMVAAVAIDAPALPDPSHVGSAALVVLTLGISAATFGYRLYEVDLIVNRTLVYAALTAILAATYFGTVVLLQSLLEPITRESDIAIVGSTLAVAALFRPLRARVQSFIDRRFYRRKYDAAAVLTDFSSRLRDQVNLDSLTGELVRVVGTTMQPAHASLWLRGGEAS